MKRFTEITVNERQEIFSKCLKQELRNSKVEKFEFLLENYAKKKDFFLNYQNEVIPYRIHGISIREKNDLLIVNSVEIFYIADSEIWVLSVDVNF